ncbi:hypothetical protein FHE72_03920 [Rossellomorea vietnamensis]|uniref:Uncharacterized protein n=1 Tax=Rossellomorea vietnamensis TaxID=218284 RepID=A0A6I6UL29_9BACI|nr:hypothetical protein [Rossellomorea vietnamensis]QHE60279.1 hypothetical protein FHE72_03920 [Rossellomorea vietnamensis]
MIIGLVIVAITLLIIGFLTPVGSVMTLLVSAILFVVALVLSLRKKGGQ